VVNLRCPRLGPRARRAARRLARRAATVAAALALVLAVRAALGVWAAAVLVALAAVAGLIAGWAAVEARVFDRPRPARPVPMPRRVPGLSAGDHTAFARALTAVATAYLTECERQEHPR
jgi:lysylphosphatidylglycerol synthetase-like protein (DUF2156 family)